jgi:2-polyprenyl-3-methyl-5-hydroxy-6-metoxy-1,4-benzoquinol methylase
MAVETLVLDHNVYGITRRARVEDDIAYAIDPLDAHNWLDEKEYDAHHAVDMTASHHLADVYVSFAPPGDHLSILEVGCGSGNLTIGLNGNRRVKRLIACDISKQMLSLTRDRLPAYPNDRTTLLCADISDKSLFAGGAFDAAFGNSLLHHIYDYEQFLTALKHTIRPGGTIAFSEPCQQGKSLISFLCALLIQLDGKSDDPVFSSHDRDMVQALLDINRREEDVRHDQALKLQWEDKHCFDTRELNDVARDLGFSSFENFNTQKIVDGLRGEVVSHLRLVGVNCHLDRFSPMFDAFQREYVSLCEPYIQTPHQMLVFTR